jgi:MFS family permease
MAKEANNKALLALLFVGVLMGALDLAIIGPALPAIKAEFGMNSRQLAVLFNAYVLCQLISTPLLAKMSDRFGPRSIYILSLCLFALGSVLLVLSPGPGWLFAGRSIQGFGAGGIFPVASAVIGAQLAPEKRGPALGLIGVVWGVAFLIGPLLGGILLRFSWHWLFIINVPIAAILIAGASKLLRGPSAAETDRPAFDKGGAVTLSIALAALVIALNNLDPTAILNSLRSPMVGPILVLSAIATYIFWRIEKNTADPIIRPQFLAGRQVRLTCLIALGIGSIQSVTVFYPTLAVSALDIAIADAAWLILPAVIASTVTSPVVGKLLNYFGTRNIIIASLTFTLTSLLTYALSDLTVMKFIFAGILGGIGSAGLLGAPLRFIFLNESRPRDRGAMQGLLNMFYSIGRLMGAAAVGTIAASQGDGTLGYQTALLFVAALAVMLVMIATRLKSRATEKIDAAKMAEATSA